MRDGGARRYHHRLVDGPACGLWEQSFPAVDAVLPVRIRLDQAGIDRKAFSAYQTLVDTAAQDGFKQPSQQIAVAEAPMPVLREGRMDGHVTVEPKAAEPAVCQVGVNLLAQAPLSERIPKQ